MLLTNPILLVKLVASAIVQKLTLTGLMTEQFRMLKNTAAGGDIAASTLNCNLVATTLKNAQDLAETYH